MTKVMVLAVGALGLGIWQAFQDRKVIFVIVLTLLGLFWIWLRNMETLVLFFSCLITAYGIAGVIIGDKFLALKIKTPEKGILK